MTRSFVIALALLSSVTGCTKPATDHAQAPAADASAMIEMDMPDGSPADMSAVPQYPGSKMVDAKIMPHLADDMMSMSYNTPAAPEVVLAWYAAELGKKGFFLDEGNKTLTGTDANGKAIRVEAEPAPSGHSVVTISKG